MIYQSPSFSQTTNGNGWIQTMHMLWEMRHSIDMQSLRVIRGSNQFVKRELAVCLICGRQLQREIRWRERVDTGFKLVAPVTENEVA